MVLLLRCRFTTTIVSTRAIIMLIQACSTMTNSIDLIPMLAKGGPIHMDKLEEALYHRVWSIYRSTIIDMIQTQTSELPLSNLGTLLSLIMLVLDSIIAKESAWKEMRWLTGHSQCSNLKTLTQIVMALKLLARSNRYLIVMCHQAHLTLV